MLFGQFLISPFFPSLRISPYSVQMRENTDQKKLVVLISDLMRTSDCVTLHEHNDGKWGHNGKKCNYIGR